jgi:hypothetical protein
MISVPYLFHGLSGEKGRRAQTSTVQNSYLDLWRLRDTLAAAFLFLGTAAFILWQNSRVAVLWDLGYLLDTSWRLALGQVPYRDFPLVHPPLTFAIQAMLIRVAGRHYLLPVLYAAVAGGLGTVLAWRIILRMQRAASENPRSAWIVSLLLAAPLVVLGVYCVYPHPIYDGDCALAILFALFLLVRLSTTDQHGGTRRALSIVAGAATVAPLFFKQNMGLPFLAAVACGLLILLVMEAAEGRSILATVQSSPALVLVGMAVALVVCLALIAATVGLGNYLHWTLQFAAQRRFPGFVYMVADYRQPSFVWAIPAVGAGLALCYSRFMVRPWARIAACCLILLPFAGSIIFLFLNDDADERTDNLLALWPLLLLVALVIALFRLRRGITMGTLIPFFVLAAIHGTFLSQQLWGSTYALWPLLMVLVGWILSALPVQARPVTIATAAGISATFLICGSFYAVSLERLSYVQMPDAAIQYSSIPALNGMADRGPYLPNLDEMVEFTEREIPRGDALLVLPGEDPFYFATGRTPRFPVTLFDLTTDPFSAYELFAEVGRRDVRWVIVKRFLQIDTDPLPQSDQTMRMIEQDFELYRRLGGYDVYRRR